MSWLLEAVPAWQINIFRELLAFSIGLKFIVEWKRGYHSYSMPGSYIYYANQGTTSWSLRAYRWLYYWRYLGLLALLLGGPLRLLTPLLIAGLYLEMRIFFKYHTNLMFLFAVLLLVAPDSAWIPIWQTDKFAMNTVPRLYYLAGCFTIASVYIFTAIHKLNPRFLSGQVITVTLKLLVQHRRKHFDNFLRPVEKWLLDHHGVIAAMMWITVAVELTLPILLGYGPTFWIGVLLGVCLHSGFALLFPTTLMHFSILMVSSYLFFAGLAL